MIQFVSPVAPLHVTGTHRAGDAMERLMRYERSLTIAEMKEMREVPTLA